MRAVNSRFGSVVLVAGLSAMGLFVAGANAALIAYDGFDYASAGALSGQSGGSGWSGTWKSDAALVNESNAPAQIASLIPPPGYSAALTGGSVTGGSGVGLGLFRAISGSPISIDLDADQNYYISILTRRTGTARAMQIALQAGATGLASFGHATGGALNVGASGGPGGQVTGPSAIGLGSTYLWVFKIDAASGTGNDQVFLQTYRSDPVPPAAQAVATEPSSFQLVGNPGVATGIVTQLSITTGNTATLEIDEIRIGTTFADVAPVPEPGASLAAILCGSLLARRRRMSY